MTRHAILTTVPLALGALALSRVAWRRGRAARYVFRDRSVVITGGTRGLGLALARRFAAEGARLWLIARSRQELAAAAEELRSHGATVWTIQADVADDHAATRIVEDLVGMTGHVDMLVNNAGIITVAPFEHTTMDDFQRSLETHFWGPLRLIRAALPHMRRQGGGRIVNISSIGGRLAVPHLSAYAAGKFALTGVSETLHAELRKDGIVVTTVTPGLMRTGSYVNAEVRGRHEDEAWWFEAMAATPLTTIAADRAARQIVEAVRRGDATCTPNWQARAAWLAYAAAPEAVSALMAATDAGVLPGPSDAPGADEPRKAADVDSGWIRRLLSERTRRRYHQPA